MTSPHPPRSTFAEVETVRECTPSYTLERHIASLRDTDPVRWAEIQAEWNSHGPD